MTRCRIQTPAGLVLAMRLDVVEACRRAKAHYKESRGREPVVVVRDDGAVIAVVAGGRAVKIINDTVPYRRSEPAEPRRQAKSKCRHEWQALEPVAGGPPTQARCSRCGAWGWKSIKARPQAWRSYVCMAPRCRRAGTIRELGPSKPKHWCEGHAPEAANAAE